MIASSSRVAKTQPNGRPCEDDLALDDLRPMTLDEYHRLIKIGFFTPDDRVELLDGYLVRKMPQDDPHAVSVSLLPDEFAKVIPAEWIVRSQLPITMASSSEPEPDGVVCLGPKRRYGAGHGHPTAKDIAIVIEVADTTLRRDRTTKLRIYARNRLPVYWIINLIENQVEVYTEPRAARVPTYRHRTDYGRGSKVPVAVRGKVVGEVQVNDLLS